MEVIIRYESMEEIIRYESMEEIDATKMDTTIYYKITNKNENHDGYQYRDGINTSDEPFEKSGSHIRRDFHFTTIDNIFKYLDDGCIVREIKLPQKCKWVKDSDGYGYRANTIILGNKYDLQNPKTFEMLVKRGADIHTDDDYVIIWASRCGYIDVLRYLVENININPCDVCVLWASKKGHIEVVRYLMEKGINIHIYDDYALKLASEKGHFEMVRYFVEMGASMDAGNDALRRAAENGHFKVVRYLVEKGADINANIHIIMQIYENGHLEIATYLMGSDILKWVDFFWKIMPIFIFIIVIQYNGWY